MPGHGVADNRREIFMPPSILKETIMIPGLIPLTTRFRIISIVILLVVGLSACTLPPPRPTEPKTPEEQALISQALEKAAGKARLDLPRGTPIYVETSGLTNDHPFAGRVLEGWLGRQGLIICRTEEEATHYVRAIVKSMGPTRSTKILGIPGGEAQTGLFGIRLPEIALYKRDIKKGFVDFYLDVFEKTTGKHLQTTKAYSNTISYKDYTLLFIITWQEVAIEDFPE